MTEDFLIKDTVAKIKDYDSSFTLNYQSKEEVADKIYYLKERFKVLHDIMYAQKKYSVLLIFQGMDCCGKDGVIKRLLSNMNPHALKISSFKVPTEAELSYDFLWRVHNEVPSKGTIGLFNRSHYEDVLVPYILGNLTTEEFESRCNHINNFEELLYDNNTIILKFFLNISKDEQKIRIKKRLSDPSKMWKFHKSDLEARENWDNYMKIYEDIFSKCNKEKAPWFIIPSDKKWFRDYAVLNIVVNYMEKLDLEYPKIDCDCYRNMEF